MTKDDGANLVRELIGRGLLNDAVAAAEASLAEGDNAELWQLLGYCRQQLGNFSGAALAASRAADLGVRDWSNHLVLAASLSSLGRYRDALRPARRGFAGSPTRVDAATLLLEVTVETEGLEGAQAWMASATMPARQSLVQAAPIALAACARRRVEAGDFSGAEHLCLHAISLKESGDLYEILGRLHQQAGRNDEAMLAFAHALELGVQDWGRHAFLSEMMGQPPLGLEPEAARLAFAKTSGLAAAVELLVVLARAGGVTMARTALREAEPEHAAMLKMAWPIALSAHVRSLLKSGKIAAAALSCEAALAEAESGLLLLRLAEVRQHEGALKAAETIYTRAAADYGVEDPGLYMALGAAALNRGEPALARRAFGDALRLDPCRIDAALALLSLVLDEEGFDAADKVRKSLNHAVDTTALEMGWLQLHSSYIPPEVAPLLSEGRIEEAEAILRTAMPVPSRRVSQWLHYLDRYRRWLAFTSAQRDRADPARKPSVAVYLVTYNHERFIGAALEGILNQDFDGEVEIHVVDDASTDGTQAVVLDYQRRYPEVIKTFFNPTNIGTLDPPQQKVTYAAFQRLRSDYCCILEGDDYWSDRGKLQKQVDFLEKHPIFSCSSHNTLKVYDDGSQPAHRFLYWPGRPPVYTIDDAVSMEMFFHTSSVVYRNILMGEPPKGFASKWSCDIFNTIAHMQYGEMRYFDEDMSVYRQHVGGGYSNRSPSWGRIFNIEGLIRYNAWLGHRHLKGFAFSINRLSLSLLRESDAGTLPPLKTMQRLRYNLTAWITGAVYDLIDRYPRLDPAVLLYKEPPRSPEPRKAKLTRYGVPPAAKRAVPSV